MLGLSRSMFVMMFLYIIFWLVILEWDCVSHITFEALLPLYWLSTSGYELPMRSMHVMVRIRAHLFTKSLDFIGFVVACWYGFSLLIFPYANIFV